MKLVFHTFGRCICVLMSVASLALVNANPCQAQNVYAVTDLGSLMPTGINDNGQVCGDITLTGGANHAAVYGNGNLQDLGVLPGYASSYANDINSGGQVVGYETTKVGGGGFSAAFLYGNGTILDLSTLPIFSGGAAAVANGINSAGQVVGQTAGGVGDSPYGFGFLYANGEIQPSPLNFNFLGSSGGIGGASFAINASGQIAGVGYNFYGGYDCAAIYSNGNLQPLVTTVNSIATAINSSGHAIGQSYQSGQPFSFLSVNGSVIPLTLTASQFAGALNDEDQIVGTMNGDATLYDGGITTDLNLLLAPGSDWDLEAATAINNSGQIVGYGINPDGQTDGFLLTSSVPEPGTVAILATTAAILLTRRRRELH